MHVAGEETEEGQSAQGKSNHTVSGLGLGSRSLRVCWLLGIIIRPHKRVQLKHILSIRRIERSPCCVHNRGLCLARRQWNVRLNYENITLSRSCLCASAMCTPRLLVYHVCCQIRFVCSLLDEQIIGSSCQAAWQTFAQQSLPGLGRLDCQWSPRIPTIRNMWHVATRRTCDLLPELNYVPNEISHTAGTLPGQRDGDWGEVERAQAYALILIWSFGSLKSFRLSLVDVSCQLWILQNVQKVSKSFN